MTIVNDVSYNVESATGAPYTAPGRRIWAHGVHLGRAGGASGLGMPVGVKILRMARMMNNARHGHRGAQGP